MPAQRASRRDRRRTDPATNAGVPYGCVFRAVRVAGQDAQLRLYTTHPVNVLGELTAWNCGGEQVTAAVKEGPQEFLMTYAATVAGFDSVNCGIDANVQYPPGIVQATTYIVIDV